MKGPSTDHPGEELSVAVMSCDGYGDLWPGFFHFFEKNWPDCPFPVYLCTNHRTFEHGSVRAIPVGDDLSWGDTTKRFMLQIPTPYVLILQEDFFLTKRVRTEEVQRSFLALKQLHGVYLRLRADPPRGTTVPGFPRVGRVEPGAPYRVSNQASIWNRETFVALLREGETPWDMESRGSRRSDSLGGGFYCARHPVLEYPVTGVVKRGKWIRRWVRVCTREGLAVDLEARSMMTVFQDMTSRFGMFIYPVMNRLPSKWRSQLVGWVRHRGW
jgi:hypothetical protein